MNWRYQIVRSKKTINLGFGPREFYDYGIYEVCVDDQGRIGSLVEGQMPFSLQQHGPDDTTALVEIEDLLSMILEDIRCHRIGRPILDLENAVDPEASKAIEQDLETRSRSWKTWTLHPGSSVPGTPSEVGDLPPLKEN